ncbi:MAG: 30S ribosomal protein S6 [Firmicutes bacterium]|nr:30S ribosomal protein S6 [Bacillota bacterium]
MDRYEIMFIVKNTIEDEAVKKEADTLQSLITSDKGKIIEFKEMGKRKLAYPIKKELTGTYYVMTVEANHDTIKEFDRKVLINENVLRHLIIKKEGEK